ncbi:hypothetical protein [Phenylobacterium sp.]|uniref:hypothetical protein n=1 Tax=Phenylobacterium sp. TaxID=1871053 RepID=UPI002F91C7FF
MSRFSASDAAVEGFRVLGRSWRVVLGWALFNLLGLIAACVLAGVLVAIAAFASAANAAGAGAAGGAIAAIVLALAMLALPVVIVAALFRMLLRDDPPGLFHLRLGRDELRLGAVWLGTLGILLIVSATAFAVTGLSARAGGPMFGIPAVLVLLALQIWIALRLSLAGPITVAERKIGFAASWRLTRGHAWSLLGMAVLAGCFLAMILILAWLLLAIVSGAVSGWDDLGLLLRADAEAMQERPGFYIAQLVIDFLFAPVLWVISQTPLVAAYRAFTAQSQA